jgi:hypothetical protein
LGLCSQNNKSEKNEGGFLSLPYSNLIILGRNIVLKRKQGEKHDPEYILAWVNQIEEQLRWTPVKDFFRLFPPVKRYADDGVWDYNSTLKAISEDFGERFGKDDVKMLLMTSCYENKFIRAVGLAYITSISQIQRERTGRDPMQEFLNQK